MSGLMIARITVKDPEVFQDYLTKTQRVAASFGAELAYRGTVDTVLNGRDDHRLVVIAKFPSLDKINEWFRSDAYRPLMALRDQGADMQMTSYAIAD